MFHDLAIERNTRSLQRVNIARVLLGADPTGAEWQGSGTGSLAATSTIGDCCMGEASEPDHIAQNRIQREMQEEKKQVENAPQEKPSRRRSSPLANSARGHHPSLKHDAPVFDCLLLCFCVKG